MPLKMPTHAVVIGGSITGLLAARILSERFEQVTVVERDSLPEAAEHRSGTPQGRHLHTLLVRGEQILAELFPHLEVDMQALGCELAHWGQDSCVLTSGGWTPRHESGISSHVIGRVSVEYLVRQRVKALPNVRFIQNAGVEGLIGDASQGQIVGLHLRQRGESEMTLLADLVVDASGRSSRAPEWLQALGCPSPETTIINAHTGYATRWYRLPQGLSLEYLMMAMSARPSQGLYRGGGYLRVEGGQVVVTLLGANGDYPPTDEAGFMAFAASLADRTLYDLIRQLEPSSPIYGYRRLENQQRHYERLTQQPHNFLVMGDAAVALNPIYGQGMTSAALQALELRRALAPYPQMTQLKGLARRFQRRVHAVTRGAWLMATSEDLRYPNVEGSRPGLMTRLIHRYFDRVAETMPYDEAVTTSFIQAMTLLKAPSLALMHPRILWRVARHHLAASRSSQRPAPRVFRPSVRSTQEVPSLS